jgi:hypothetical protein
MMYPQEDTIVALRPTVPHLPFKVPDSVRPLDPDVALGAPVQGTGIDPVTGAPITVTNALYNFGWEYVWHCHLLGHEDSDMMRPMVLDVTPTAPTNLSARVTGAPSVTFSWTNNATYPAAHNMLIQRADDAAFTTGVTTIRTRGTATMRSDPTVVAGSTYYYRVRAESTVSYSDWSNVVTVVALPKPGRPYAVTARAVPSASGPASIDTAWKEAAGYTVTGFELQWATNTGYTTNFGSQTLSGSANSYTITGLVRNTRYYFRVRAVYGAVSSTYGAAYAKTVR